MTDPDPARRVHVIGIGTGSPEHITAQASTALNEVNVFLVADKGGVTDELVAIRRAICDRFIEGDDYRVLTVPDPQRGPDARRDGAQYLAGVDAWHTARAARYAEVIAGLRPHDVVGFLVWGDPAFYDSTLRILETVGQRIPLQIKVTPGLTAFQVLAAEHGIVLNGIGSPVHITTGRRLIEEWRPGLGTVVVMLDGALACAGLVDREPDLTLHWGAYLGMPQQALLSGRLADVIDEVRDTRARLRAEHGWLMDIYSLTPSAPGTGPQSSRSPSTSR